MGSEVSKDTPVPSNAEAKGGGRARGNRCPCRGTRQRNPTALQMGLSSYLPWMHVGRLEGLKNMPGH